MCWSPAVGQPGLSAAVAAAEQGASVMLVEHGHQLGGHLNWGDDAARSVRAELVAAVICATPGSKS